MSVYFVSRHIASVEWFKKQEIEVDVWLTHLDDETPLRADDVVIGNLPINIVATLSSKRIHYIHLSIEVPEELRGVELSFDHLNKYPPKLLAFRVQVDDGCQKWLDDQLPIKGVD